MVFHQQEVSDYHSHEGAGYTADSEKNPSSRSLGDDQAASCAITGDVEEDHVADGQYAGRILRKQRPEGGFDIVGEQADGFYTVDHFTLDGDRKGKTEHMPVENGGFRETDYDAKGNVTGRYVEDANGNSAQTWIEPETGRVSSATYVENDDGSTDTNYNYGPDKDGIIRGSWMHCDKEGHIESFLATVPTENPIGANEEPEVPAIEEQAESKDKNAGHDGSCNGNGPEAVIPDNPQPYQDENGQTKWRAGRPEEERWSDRELSLELVWQRTFPLQVGEPGAYYSWRRKQRDVESGYDSLRKARE